MTACDTLNPISAKGLLPLNGIEEHETGGTSECEEVGRDLLEGALLDALQVVRALETVRRQLEEYLYLDDVEREHAIRTVTRAKKLISALQMKEFP